MDPDRRAVAALVVVAVVLAAGCVGFVLGNEPLRFPVHDEAAVDDAAASQAGYELVDRRQITLERHILLENGTVVADVSGYDGEVRTVVVNATASVYAKNRTVRGEEFRVGTFAVLTMPEVKAMGQRLNPVQNERPEALLDRILARVDTSAMGALRNVRRVDARGVEVLGEPVRITRFAADTTVRGRDLTVSLYAGKAYHEGDYVVVLGGHADLFRGERWTLYDLMESVAHDASS